MSVEGSKLGPLQDLIGFHFRRTSSAIRKHFEMATEGLGIHQVSFGVLSVISANPGIRQGEVGEILDIRRANMVTIVNDLTRAGLIARGHDPKDKRAVTLSLTDKGEVLLNDALTRIRAHESRIVEGLTERECTQLRAMLGNVYRNCS